MRAIVQAGAAVSMADIAAACGVSKALLHYHYASRARLLADVVHHLATRLVARERAALTAAAAGDAVDALRRWTDAELRRGELHALVELSFAREPEVREAAARAAEARRASAAATTSHLFAELGLTPRLPTRLLADASVAFLDGLVLDDASARDPRVSFDIFWLALLGLAE